MFGNFPTAEVLHMMQTAFAYLTAAYSYPFDPVQPSYSQTEVSLAYHMHTSQW